MILSNPLFDSMKFYILIMLLLILIKPKLIYSKKNKKFRKFGYKKNQTIFTLPILSIIIAIIIYIFILLIHKLYNNNINRNYITYPQYINYIPNIPNNTYIPNNVNINQ